MHTFIGKAAAASNAEKKKSGRVVRGPKLYFTACDQHSVTLTWSTRDKRLLCQLQYIDISQHESWEWYRVLKPVSGGLSYEVRVGNLKPSHTYTFRVQLITPDGNAIGEAGPECSVDTQGACCIVSFVAGPSCEGNLKCLTFVAGYEDDRDPTTSFRIGSKRNPDQKVPSQNDCQVGTNPPSKSSDEGFNDKPSKKSLTETGTNQSGEADKSTLIQLPELEESKDLLPPVEIAA